MVLATGNRQSATATVTSVAPRDGPSGGEDGAVAPSPHKLSERLGFARSRPWEVRLSVSLSPSLSLPLGIYIFIMQ